MPEEIVTNKYKLIFLNASDYEEIHASIPVSKLGSYQALTDIGVDNFSVSNSSAIFIHEKHKDLLRMKARKGERV